tara:strand:- start:353 stop:1303 length:951 start_codon:yes stop_codon:yes gene_type:complete
MAFKKPKKEKKSRLKDIEELLKTLDKGRLTEDNFEFITEPPEGMVRNPLSTMEFRDYNQNGIEDREEGLFLPRDFVPEDSLRKGPKPVPFPEMGPSPFDKGPKPVPLPKMRRLPFSKDLGDIFRERELIEVFDKELGRNVFISKDKVLEDEGRYSPTKRAGGGVMNINTMTEPLGYDDGGDVGFLEGIRQSLNNFIKYQRKDPERFFGGRDGMEFHLDDPSLIQFIKKRAETDDEDSPEYRDELMKFMEEVSPKKNQGGIISLAGGGETKMATASGMHPLVEFKEMYDQYLIDGGEMSFKEFFDMIQLELDKQASG